VISQSDRGQAAFFGETHYFGWREDTVGGGAVQVQIDASHENPFEMDAV
jgi:hypothetical protein